MDAGKRSGGRLVRAAALAGQTYGRTACNQRAAAISYHVLFSLIPFLALLFSVLELVLPETMQEQLVAWLVGVPTLPEDVREGVEGAVEQVGGTSASVAGPVALAGLVWGASAMMGSIRSAFRAVWASEADRPYLRGKLLDALLVLGAGLLIVTAFGLSVVVQVATEAGAEVARKLGREEPTSALGTLGQLGVSLAVALVALLLLYRTVPPVHVRLRDVVPGALAATVGLHLASAGFSVYLTRFADFDEVYGPLGAVLAFLLLVYLSAAIILGGACLAAAWPQAATAPRAGPRVSLRNRVVRALRGLVLRDNRR